MSEFGTKAYSKPLRIAMRVAAVLLLIAFIATWVKLMNDWPKLDVLRVYIYMAFFVGYLAVEQRAFRGPDEDAYSDRIWVRYLLTYAWWFLALGSLLEHALTLRSHPVATIIGVVLAVLGLAFGFRAASTLNKELGKRVDTWAGLRIVETGPYKWMRHPAYLASMLIVIGLPLVMNAYFSLILSAVLVYLFLQRLILEERVLSQRLPAYAEYMQHTHRLIPGIW
ncbi:MAG: methyltransferase family protein [Anaerolineae bacterium]